MAQRILLRLLSLLSLVALAPGQASEDQQQLRAELEDLRAFDPDSPVVLERWSRLLGQEGDRDGQLAYLLCALDGYEAWHFEEADEREALVERLEAELADLDEGGDLRSLRRARDEYLEDLLFALKLYARNQKKPRNALEVGGRILRFRPDHPSGNRFVQEVLEERGDEVALEVERLLGMKALNRPRSFLVEWARQHGTWEEADVVTTERYRVVTDIGYEVLQRAARGLDQISDYYQSFYGVGRELQRGRTEVFLCRRRVDFERAAKNPITRTPGLRAFINSLLWRENDSVKGIEFDIYGFDPRDAGDPLESLWGNLWHEASHQYMRLAMVGKSAPWWLDEGMASYFEGARVAVHGEVTVGLPASHRLANLHGLLLEGERPLAEVIAGPRAVTGAHYAVAWGVVYHLVHDRDEEGRTHRRHLLDDLLERAARDSEDGAALFAAGVLDPLGQSLEEFEDEWIAAMHRLFEQEVDPVARAAELVRQGTEHGQAGRWDVAGEYYEEALLRDPESAAAKLGRARVARQAYEATRKRDRDLADETLLWARRAHEGAWRAGDEDLREAAFELAKEVDRVGFKKIVQAEEDYRARLERLLATQLAAGRPRTALAVAELFVDDVLGDSRRDRLARELREAGTLRLERRLQVFDGETLSGLSVSPTAFQVEEGLLVGRSERPDRAPIFLEHPTTPSFRMELEVWLADPDTLLGLGFAGGGGEGIEGFVLRPELAPGHPRMTQGFLPFDQLLYDQVTELSEPFVPARMAYDYRVKLPAASLGGRMKSRRWTRVTLSRDEREGLVLHIDGHEVARRAPSSGGGEAQLRMVLYGGELRLRRLDVVEMDRL